MGVKKIGSKETDTPLVGYFVVFHKKGDLCKISSMPKWENRSFWQTFFKSLRIRKKQKTLMGKFLTKDFV